MGIVWRNKIKNVLETKGWTISDLQKATRMSYPATHRVVTAEVITDDTKVITLRRIAAALDVNVVDLYEEVEE
jgi:hypothetical protein